jgi:hypothetical protein
MAGGSAQADASPSAKMTEFCSLPPAWPRIGLLVTALFVSMWLVYFLSRSEVQFFPGSERQIERHRWSTRVADLIASSLQVLRIP